MTHHEFEERKNAIVQGIERLDKNMEQLDEGLKQVAESLARTERKIRVTPEGLDALLEEVLK